VHALSAFGAAGLVFLAPDGARLPEDVANLIDESGLSRSHVETSEELLRVSDAVCAIPFELSDSIRARCATTAAARDSTSGSSSVPGYCAP
jgi:hypothetical protein